MVTHVVCTTYPINTHTVLLCFVCCRCRCIINSQKILVCCPYFEGILRKGPYLPCVSMAGRAILAGYPRFSGLIHWQRCNFIISTIPVTYMGKIDRSSSQNRTWQSAIPFQRLVNRYQNSMRKLHCCNSTSDRSKILHIPQQLRCRFMWNDDGIGRCLGVESNFHLIRIAKKNRH